MADPFSKTGDGNYLAAGYFSSEAQDSERWTYYRDRTEGQNTLLMDSVSQNVLAAPTTDFATTGESQDSLDYTPANSSTAFFRMDFSTTYNNTCARLLLRLVSLIIGC